MLVGTQRSPVFVTWIYVVEATEAFESWYRQAHPRLIAALVSFCGSVEIAADATDEACMRAMVRWDRVSGMDSPDGWVYRVAVNHAKRRMRRARMERLLLAKHRRADSPTSSAARYGTRERHKWSGSSRQKSLVPKSAFHERGLVPDLFRSKIGYQKVRKNASNGQSCRDLRRS